jgi:hypothetical protein
MIDVCPNCGAFGELEAHHVAGRHNHPTLTMPECTDCHSILSARQRARGVELRKDAPRGELDATRALVVGVVDLLTLLAQRHPDHIWLPAPLAVHTGRAISRLLDACGPPDRDGRWLPDPRVRIAEAVPVAWPPADSDDRRVTEWAHLLRVLSEILGEPLPLPPGLLTDLAAHPDRYRKAAARAAEDATAIEDLALLVTDYVARSQQMIEHLLALDDPMNIGAELVEEGRACLAAGRRLLDAALALLVAGEVPS